MDGTLLTATTDAIGPQIGVAATIPTASSRLGSGVQCGQRAPKCLYLGSKAADRSKFWLCPDRQVLDCLDRTVPLRPPKLSCPFVTHFDREFHRLWNIANRLSAPVDLNFCLAVNRGV